MSPVPLEGHQAVVPQESRGGSISLGMLIDFIVQRTYHELSVLAELLPRKTDMERKIEIYNFAARTRQLFVRLLALVKWANSASKVDKSAQIMAFLDKQSTLFVETADMLARMARETLVNARLPNFHISAAVEVLTTGTYSRMPSCIRERVVPPDPITSLERRQTLLRLNQVIQHRLVTSQLPPQMRNLKIECGRVTFHVEHEFEVSLTVMGDGPNIPWRLLDIDILVEDKETGDGKSLVHSLQIQFIHQLIQSRLVENSQPLVEVYNCLHHFCQSLQLEVLYSQTLRLIRDRLGDQVRVDEYIPGRCLVVSYWRELTSRDPKSELGYHLTVQVDPHDSARPLMVFHTPSLGSKESELAERAIRSDYLSMERLLVHTIYVRTRARLTELKQDLQQKLKDTECQLQGSPAILGIPVLQPCLRAEQLLVTVDTHSGTLLAHVPQYDPPIISEVQHALNFERSKLDNLLMQLRFWITQRRCEKTLQHLPATAREHLPLLYTPSHPINNLSNHRVYVLLHRHPGVLLIVELKERPGCPSEVDFGFHLAVIKRAAIEDESIESELPKMYLRVESLIEFDNFVITHGPFTYVDDQLDKVSGKRKSAGKPEPQSRRSKHPAYFIPELAHVVALCDERIPFVTLAEQLSRQGVSHQGLQVEAGGTALVLRLVQLPVPDGVSKAAMTSLTKRLLAVALRVQGKGSKSWLAEFVFYSSPLQSAHPKEQGLRRPVYFTYPIGSTRNAGSTVDSLLVDWAGIAHLYESLMGLDDYLQQEKLNISGLITVRSYTYSRLILGYGPDRTATITVHWNDQKKAFKLCFGASCTGANPHVVVCEQLEAHLNHNRSLVQLVQLLLETYDPLCAIIKLPSLPHLGVNSNRPLIPVQVFTLVAQTPLLLRLIYQDSYCLELRLRGGGILSLRDGAYSLFNRSNVVQDFTPTQGLKAFLSKYVDESAVFRRRSQSEDDNPPSPVTMDSDAPFLSSHHPQSPVQKEVGGLRFQHPLTPPSGSNPHTPASPHANISQTGQHQSFGSSPATSFNLASPPSLPPNITQSPSMMPHQSPGSGMLASSPSTPIHAPSPGLLPTSSPTPGSQVQVGQSPVGSFMGQTGHTDGSPFPSSQSLTSPAASNWPGSPSVPRPSPASRTTGPSAAGHLSRVLPQRSWAGAVPTLLTHEALDVLCTPTPHPGGLPCPPMSPLERFLGCVYMRRHLQRLIQNEDFMTALASSEPGVVHFHVEALQCRLGLNPQHMQSLHLKVSPVPEHKDSLTTEELQILEKFFDSKAVVPPFKPNYVTSFCRILGVPINIIKDFIQILKLELVPGLLQQQQMKWSVQFCLRIPPSATPIVPLGTPSMLIHKNKILFFLHITRIGVQYAPGTEVPNMILPLLYDVITNMTSLVPEKRDVGPASSTAAASHQLRRFAEFGLSHSECSIFPAVRDLLLNLVLPSEPPSQNQMQGQGPLPGQVPPGAPNPGQQQGGPHAAMGMQASLQNQMHSPMHSQIHSPMQSQMQAQAQFQGMAMGQHGMMPP